jgi:3-phenylpropionate/cinnamic acid dioxygenase small subunit
MDLAQRPGDGAGSHRAPTARPPGRRRKHFTANIIIELAGDHATVASNFLVVRDSETGPAIAVAGTYDDTVVRTPEGWKFKSRRLSHDIAGESGLNAKPA